MGWVVRDKNSRAGRLLSWPLVFVAMAAATPAGALTPEQIDAWALAHPSPGWTRVTDGTNSIGYLRDNSCVPEGQYRRCWNRIELFEPSASGAVSYVVLLDFDCAKSRTRIVQMTGYDEHQARGRNVGTFPGSMTWSFEVPESNGELMLKAVCR